jgi:hypothetical protein
MITHTETNNRQESEPPAAFFHYLYYRDRGNAGRSLRFIHDEVDACVQVLTTHTVSKSRKIYAYTLFFRTPNELTEAAFVLQVTRPDEYDLNNTSDWNVLLQIPDERTLLSAPTNCDHLVPFRIGSYVCRVSPELKSGYLAACKAYTEMVMQTGSAYFLLTGYEYAHLARQYLPRELSPVSKREWHRGFVAGWNVCTFGLAV